MGLRRVRPARIGVTDFPGEDAVGQIKGVLGIRPPRRAKSAALVFADNELIARRLRRLDPGFDAKGTGPRIETRIVRRAHKVIDAIQAERSSNLAVSKRNSVLQ